jgi:uncharacterized protein YbjT (DUF2867 family)
MLGRHVTEALTERGHEVRVLSRKSPDHPVDLTTGSGLEAAIEGCDVVVDASNNASRHAADTLVGGSRRLLAAEAAAGVGHHVCVSIVGCDLVPFGYYRAKVEQEKVVEDGPVPWSIVRATQFHEFAAGLLGISPVIPVPGGKVQTVASAEVAVAVADAAECPALGKRLSVAGPEIVEIGALVREWKSITGSHSLRLPIPVPGKMGRAIRAGALTTAHPDVRGTLTFGAWLKRNRSRD